jgi:hypothetical protein
MPPVVFVSRKRNKTVFESFSTITKSPKIVTFDLTYRQIPYRLRICCRLERSRLMYGAGHVTAGSFQVVREVAVIGLGAKEKLRVFMFGFFRRRSILRSFPGNCPRIGDAVPRESCGFTSFPPLPASPSAPRGSKTASACGSSMQYPVRVL